MKFLPNSRRLSRWMRVKPICNLVFWFRFFWYVRVRRTLRRYEGTSGVNATGRDHNEKSLLHGKPSDRILRLIYPMAAIDRLNEKSKVLAIGVRYETDLLYLMAYGFPNCRGLDLFSYSPWVDLGDMHEMSYEADSFDAVMLGWTLAYSDDQKKAAREIVRVTRNGGIVAISNSYYPEERLKELAGAGEPIGGFDRRQTVASILELFEGRVERVYFQHDANPQWQGACLVVFAISKN